MANAGEDDLDGGTGQETESGQESYLLYSYPEEEEVAIVESSRSSPNRGVGDPGRELEELPNGDGISIAAVSRESHPSDIEENRQFDSNGRTACSETSPDTSNLGEQLARDVAEPTSQRTPRRLSESLRGAIHEFIESFLCIFGVRGIMRLLVTMNNVYGYNFNNSDPLLERLIQYAQMENHRNSRRVVPPRHYSTGFYRIRPENIVIAKADSTTEEISERTNPENGENESHVDSSPVQCSVNEMAHDEQSTENIQGRRVTGMNLRAHASSENYNSEESKGKHTKNNSQNVSSRSNLLNKNVGFATCLRKKGTPKSGTSKTCSNEAHTSQSNDSEVANCNDPAIAHSNNSRMHISGPSTTYSPHISNRHSNDLSISNTNGDVPSNHNSTLRPLTNGDSNKLSSENESRVVSYQEAQNREIPVQEVNNAEESNNDLHVSESNSHQSEHFEGTVSQNIPRDQGLNEENEGRTWAAQFPFLEAAVQGRQMSDAGLIREAPRQPSDVVRRAADSTSMSMEINGSHLNVRAVVGDNLVLTINGNFEQSSGRRRSEGRRRGISRNERRMLRIRYLASLLRYSRSGTNRPALNRANGQFAPFDVPDRNRDHSIPTSSGINSSNNNFRSNVRNIRVRSNELSGRIANQVPFRADIVIHNAAGIPRSNVPRPLSNRPPGPRPIWARAAWLRPSWALASLPRIAYMRPSWARPPWIHSPWARPIWIRPSWALPVPGRSSRIRNVPLHATSLGATATRSSSLYPSWSRQDWLRYRWTRLAANRHTPAQVRGFQERPTANNANAARNNPLRQRNLGHQEQARTVSNREREGRLWTRRIRAVRYRRFSSSHHPSGSRQ